MPAVPAFDEIVHHAAAQRTGTVERNQGHQVLEDLGLELAQQFAHAAALKLEDADGARLGQQPVGRRVVERQVVAVDFDAAIFVDHSDRVVDHRQGAQAEEIHFQEAHALHVVHRVLGDHFVLGAFGQRHDVVQGLGRNHHPGSVHRGMPRQPLQPPRRIDQARHLRVALLDLAQPRLLFHGVVERHVQAIRYQLGDAVHLAVRHVHGAPHVAQHALGQHGAEGDDLGDVFGAVFLRDVADDLVAPIHAEVDVDVGHGDAFRIQEALEQQVVAQRVDVGDTQRVGDQAAGHRAAPRPHRDVVLARIADEIPDDQEVARIAGVADDAEFLVEPLLVGVVIVLALAAAAAGMRQPLFQPLAGNPLQIGVEGHAVRRLVTRQQGLVEGQLQVAALGDQQRVGARFRHLGKDAVHLLRGLDVELLLLVAQALGIVHALAGADAHQHVVRRSVLFAQVVAVIGGDDRQAEVLAELQQLGVGAALAVNAVIHELQVHVVVSQNLAVAVDGVRRLLQVAVEDVSVDFALEAAGEADQALGMLGQKFFVDAGTVIKALQERLAQEAGEVLITGVIAGQQGQVVRRRADALAAAVEARGRRHVGLAAQNRLDAARLRRLVEFHGAEHVAVVGNGHGRHVKLLGAVQELVDAVGAVQQAELGVQVKMNETLLPHECAFSSDVLRYSA